MNEMKNMAQHLELGASSPAPSIDTPEFTGRLVCLIAAQDDVERDAEVQGLIAHINAWGVRRHEAGQKEGCEALSVAHAEVVAKLGALSAETVADGLQIIELRATNAQLRERVTAAEAHLAARPAVDIKAAVKAAVDQVIDAFISDPDDNPDYHAGKLSGVHELQRALLSQDKPAAPATVRDSLPVADAQAKRAAAIADTDQVPYLIVYDDVDQQSEPVIGGTRARYRFDQISTSWNAHLYVKIASNSRDEKYPSARIEQLAARAVGGVDGLKAWRDLSRDEVRQIIRKWEHVGEDGMGLFLRFKQAAAAPVVDGDERALTDKGLLNWLENQDHVHALKWRCGENVKTALHDRDRKIIGEGPTLREAVRAAIAAQKGGA